MIIRTAIALSFLAACSSTKDPAPAPASAPQASTPAPTPAPAPTPEAAGPLKAGDPAPDVTLALHDGTSVALSSLKGSHVLVYFYPKDDTPGCTVEAQGLRDRKADLDAAGIKVFGVSADDAASHQAFIEKHTLPFPLVVDGAKVAEAFRVPLMANGMTERESFLIGPDGKIKAVWLDVSPSTHAADVLAAAK